MIRLCPAAHPPGFPSMSSALGDLHCPLRRRRRRICPPRATQTSRRSHLATPANRHLPRPRREGQCPLLRPQTRSRETVDRKALDLRPTDEQALHPQRKSTKTHPLSRSLDLPVEPDLRFVRVLNWGRHRDLLPEVSGDRWTSRYDNIPNYHPFNEEEIAKPR
jgi:hypothetical protein